MRRGGISALLALACWGCGRAEPPKPPAPDPAPVVPAPPPVPEPPLPALGEIRLREWDEVEEEKFLELPAPSTPPLLRWDFSPGRRYGYEFSETLTQRLQQEASGRRGENRLREKDRGSFELAAGPDRTAAALVKILTVEATMNEQPLKRPPVEKNQSAVSECVVTEEGLATRQGQTQGRADASFYFNTLLAIQPGERPLTTGTIRTKLAGYCKVERYECARLESEFEVAAEKPSERHLMRGRVVVFFAMAERKPVRSSAAVATSTRSNGLTKEGVWVTHCLDAVTTYRLRLIEGP